MTNAWPDKAQFQSLQTKVDGLQASSVPRLRDGGTDIGQQISSSAATQNYLAVNVRPVALQTASREEHDMSELWLQVPATATQMPTLAVRLSGQGGAVLPLSGDPTYIQADGARWLAIPLRHRLSYLDAQGLRVDFGQAYPLLVGVGSDQNGQVDTEGQTGPNAYEGAILGVRFICQGARNIVGRLAPDAFPMVSTPTADLPEGAVELVLDTAPPYLRTVQGGQEYFLEFTASAPPPSDGGGAT